MTSTLYFVSSCYFNKLYFTIFNRSIESWVASILAVLSFGFYPWGAFDFILANFAKRALIYVYYFLFKLAVDILTPNLFYSTYNY